MNRSFLDTGSSFTIILTLSLVALHPVTSGEMDGAGAPGLGDLSGVLEGTPLIRPRSQVLLGCLLLASTIIC